MIIKELGDEDIILMDLEDFYVYGYLFWLIMNLDNFLVVVVYF